MPYYVKTAELSSGSLRARVDGTFSPEKLPLIKT